MFDSGIWQYAEKWQRNISFNLDEKEDGVYITYDYELPFGKDAKSVVFGKWHKLPNGEEIDNHVEGIKVKVSYKVTSNGECYVKASYPGEKGIPQIPLFGMQFIMDKNFEEYSFYGNGPMDNYNDRNFGARLGIFKDTATDNFTGYSIPQACGNRTEVRMLTLTDGKDSLTFEAVNKPFECTVLHYTETQIEEAYHKEELPRPTYTFVKVLGAQMGVGGDDSWGAQVHEPYRIYSENALEYEFKIKV